MPIFSATKPAPMASSSITGARKYFNTNEALQLRPNDEWTNIEESKTKFPQFYEQMSSNGSGLISLYFHPCEFIHTQFWDMNFARGANPTREQWQIYPLRPPDSREHAFSYFKRSSAQTTRHVAVELPLAGVPIERVSVLLGHQSVRIAERHYNPWNRARQEQLEADLARAFGARSARLSPNGASPIEQNMVHVWYTADRARVIPFVSRRKNGARGGSRTPNED